MKKHVALTLLAITVLGVLNAHVDLQQVDGRTFVAAQGRLHDPLGWGEDQWNRLTRRCGLVRLIEAGAEPAAASLAVIRDFSPPDSRSARLLQLQSLEDWLLAEVEFDGLSPAVVALRRDRHGGLQVADRAIWSGDTLPWRPAPMIRRHLRQTAPQMPPRLVACFTPSAALFRAR